MPTTSNGFEMIARRYLAQRPSVMWSDWNLHDPLAFEEAVAWLANVFREALKPEDPLDA